GLDFDFRRQAWPSALATVKVADHVVLLTARCEADSCSAPAFLTRRLVNGQPAAYEDPVVVVGAEETYQPVCRHHHRVRMAHD
ncbi:MAG: Thymidine kinase, partial [uncultured bacterium]